MAYYNLHSRWFWTWPNWKNLFLGLGGALILLVLALMLIGFAFIDSASYLPRKGISLDYADKQLQWAAIGLVCFVLTMFVDIRRLLKSSSAVYLFYIFTFGLLILTALIGVTRGGARSWIKLGPMMLQTSETVKISVIMLLAHILVAQQRNNTWKDLLFPYTITFVPVALILVQPDFGTALLFVPVVTIMVFVAGAPPKYFLIMLLAILNIAPIVYKFGLHEYQRSRVLMFLAQGKMTQEEKRGSGYQLIQAQIAYGNGGLTGKGWKQGTQNRYSFLPERHTDFILAVIGEEWGFIRTMGILLIYFALFFTMMVMAYVATSQEAQLVIVGIATLLATQAIVNICMTIGLAPITGLPLPFISYGGSSLLFNLIGIALVISVYGGKTTD